MSNLRVMSRPVFRAILTAAILLPLVIRGEGQAFEREVKGNILLANPFGAAKVQRCLELTVGEISQGVNGWVLAVTAGTAFTLEADEAGDDFDIYFYDDLGECTDNRSAPSSAESGDESGIVPADAKVGIILMYFGAPGAGFTYRETDAPPTSVDAPKQGIDPRKQEFTVVALIDYGFNPYHYDFVGHQHPWNLDSDPGNDFDAYADPAAYIEGYPGAVPLKLTIPTSPEQDVSGLAEKDQAEWDKMRYSTLDQANLHWLAGTKVIAALNFEAPSSSDLFIEAPFYGTNSDHGTRSAASLAGNIHGTCPECLIVMIHGFWQEAVAWAASQPWIDVITNSWEESLSGGFVRDGISLTSPVEITRKAVESGQTIGWAAGNGLINAFDAPQLTYWSAQKGPDWILTVGAAEPGSEQEYSGSGKPVDISSIGSSYPSTGGNSATGEGTHSGTSNATPVIGGTFAKLIQKGRETLGDTTEGHADGVVASGTLYECGSANRDCVLADGVLTRAEVQEVLFSAVLPAPLRLSLDTTWPSTQYSYYYQGHGVLSGRAQEPADFISEQQSVIDVLTGAAKAPQRPAGERNWFITDSKCRQRLWGSWNYGYFKGVNPALGLLTDPIAVAFEEWCSQAEEEAFLNIAREFGYQDYVPPNTPQLAMPPAPDPAPGTPPSVLSASKVRVVRDTEVVERDVERTVIRESEPTIVERAAPPVTVAGTDSGPSRGLITLAIALLAATAGGTAGFRLGLRRARI